MRNKWTGFARHFGATFKQRQAQRRSAMSNSLDVQVQLSAQRALWGQVPPTLRAVSVDIDERKVSFRCIFDEEMTEDDWELLSAAAAEIIADFAEPYTIEEEYLEVESSCQMNHLKHLVYLRHEKQDGG